MSLQTHYFVEYRFIMNALPNWCSSTSYMPYMHVFEERGHSSVVPLREPEVR